MRRFCCERLRDGAEITSVFGLVLLATLCLPAAMAQTPSASGQTATEMPGLVLEQTVRRVVVDVVVTDSHGNPVTGLTADDFRVFEDGQPQGIRQFDAHTPESGQMLPARPSVLPVDTFVNLPVTTEDEHAPLTVILFDALNTSLRDQLYARQQMIRFLNQLPPGVPTAIFVLSNRLHLLQGFSGEREVLAEAAKRQGPVPDQEGLLPETDSAGAGSVLTPARESQLSPADTGAPPGSLPSQGSVIPGVSSNQPAGQPVPVSGPMSADTLLTHMSDEMSSDLLDRRVDLTLTALDAIARFLSSVPGRKNLIWLSGSFPLTVAPDPSAGPMMFDNERAYSQQVEDTDNLLCMSQVAVYPVDARALMAPILQSGPTTTQTYAATYAAQLAAEQGTMIQIADETGGTAYFNTNELAKAFHSAVDNGSNYYSLTYAPTNPNFNGKLRHIRVTVEGKGYHLAYRRSYYADNLGGKSAETSELADVQPGSLMSALEFGAPEAHELIFAARLYAVGAPANASPDQMAQLMPYLQGAAQAEGLNFSKPKTPLPMQHYLVQFGVMAREMQMPQESDGKYHAELSFAVMSYDAQGNPLGGEQTTVEAVIPPARMDQFRKQGYQAVENVYVPAGAASLRIAVRDGLSSRIGSLEVPLPLSPVAGAAANGR
jgi:VWFA-related protein